jgi:copper chaperone CopZ
MRTTKLKIEGLHCLSCVDRVEKALEAIPGVHAANVKLEDVTTVEHDDLDLNKLMQAVSGAGDYKAHIVREGAVDREVAHNEP